MLGQRGNGILNKDGQEWLNADSNEIYTHNPAYEKYLTEQKKTRLSKIAKKNEKEEVTILPDTVGELNYDLLLKF